MNTKERRGKHTPISQLELWQKINDPDLQQTLSQYR